MRSKISPSSSTVSCPERSVASPGCPPPSASPYVPASSPLSTWLHPQRSSAEHRRHKSHMLRLRPSGWPEKALQREASAQHIFRRHKIQLRHLIAIARARILHRTQRLALPLQRSAPTASNHNTQTSGHQSKPKSNSGFPSITVSPLFIESNCRTPEFAPSTHRTSPEAFLPDCYRPPACAQSQSRLLLPDTRHQESPPHVPSPRATKHRFHSAAPRLPAYRSHRLP